jgi:biotin operon repressor
VITFRFGREDVLRTRFALSPLFEVTSALQVLRDPGRHSLHLPWAAMAHERLAGIDLELLALLQSGGHDYHPDFTAPPPRTPLPDVDDELERVLATPAERVRHEVLLRFRGQDVPEAARALVDDPPRWLPVLVDQMRALWALAIAPHWPAMRAVLDADILHRARQLTEAGPGDVFAALHPEVRWDDGALLVDRAHEHDLELAGRGLLLVPVVFAWPRVFAMTDAPWQPTLLYAPRGVANLWGDEPARPAPGALGELLGRRRATILAALDEPATTSALAATLGASPASVSEHLGVLRRAGLVVARRDGRRVLYARSPTGDAVVG